MIRFALRLSCGVFALLAAFEPAAAQSPVYTVAKVAVNTKASDAVTAKEQAIREGSQRAFRKLLSRLVAFKAHDRLPELSASAIDGMLDGFVVREERFSSTRYIATLDFTFEAGKIRDLLNRIGLPHTDQQSPPVKLLPVAQGESVGETWRAAWGALDLKHGLAPLDMPPAQAASLPAGMSMTARAVQVLQGRLGAPRLVLAFAAVDASGGRLRVALRGEDAVGRFAFAQDFRVYDGDIAEAAGRAARIARMALEARWRLTSLKTQGALDGPAPLESFALTAAFDSLPAWQDMRSKISSISGVQDVEVKSLFAGGAELVLSFPGGAERFAKAAAARGLTLDRSGGEWILRQR
ncbi:hypothetical protein [Dichotomicrobium thermohalophilum]|uniref:DUF2066 domain-containing protein n=1 Tax=Dichotomicrobium thermohalophilum TaxID=933063 RepID=A0A397QBG7_9HYPH|nr:hypothetical protein [Dichotomicrobium thermohalophilum]RIA56837.1 hypothetical protein BXY53_1950 [Dichotomicrobium thermohalophilum]